MLKRCFSGLMASCLLMLAPVINSQEISPATQSMAALIKNLKTYQADFDQRVMNEYGKEMDYSTGTFTIQKPNHFRWEVKEQFPQLIVADGEHLWTHDMDLEQVTIQNQNEVVAGSPLLFLTSGAKQLAASFDITQLEVKEAVHQLFSLKPKSEESVFDSVTILFEEGKLTELYLADTLGQNTIVKFYHVKQNEKIDPALFSFQMPEGVDIVDSRATVTE
ncbi:outer membrane lipoprotein chaperone LolA [Aliikangiella marina]|uniref:Outer-membrane lipoprotein carrier protein n=1 Tax=Aliikangiella marina TaxID=1712262 RepID=A0A545THD5_9GAMM|nr:outer membrane lipoprotein chaperone LolA [Aliikangiella marina]TQV76625.1 outer membrane lipoprotein chaperone LolA [Aliikangiella marina]